MNAFNDELVTSKEVCEFLKISKVTLWSLEKKEIFPRAILIGKKKRWKRSEIEAYLESARKE
ncbi:MAG: helix-turn-helix domain-containing protein [Holosporaceae bacterium]|nr:helix-turn-helix domain-containing protein [Holosporaceae bacterium]